MSWKKLYMLNADKDTTYIHGHLSCQVAERVLCRCISSCFRELALQNSAVLMSEVRSLSACLKIVV